MVSKRVFSIILAITFAVTPLAVGPTPTAEAIPAGTRVEVYKDNLDFPIDMAWVAGTRKIFFTEKNTGKVRVMVGRNLLTRACVDLDVESDGESGALGIALHPRFKQTKMLYVYYTNATPLENRVTRFVVENNRCTSSTNIVTGIRYGAGYHNGGQLEFVNGKLFVSTGEAHSPAEAQDTNNRLGKILRYNPDGSIPKNNPFNTLLARNPVWSYGHRNPFGLGHKPGSGRLYETENGPSCDDELNRIRRGGNYGWGAAYECGEGVGTNPVAPMKRWTPVIVPTDLAWYRGRMQRLNGSLYMGDFQNGNLHRFRLNDRGTRIRKHTVIRDSDQGIVDVAIGPGRWLYFITTDFSGDGEIRRIVPD